MNFNELPEFSKEVKKLSKKWRTIPNDLKLAKQVIPLFYANDSENDSRQFREAYFKTRKATVLTSSESFEVVKMHLDCKSPGAGNKLRMVLTYVVNQDTVTFIELYSKSDKDREDKRRIEEFVRGLAN
jgi:hypothetical protein